MLKFLKTVKKFSYKPQPFPALLSHLRDKWASYSGNVNNNNNDHFININEISAIVSASLNRITGYDKVSLLKDKVVLKDEELALLKESVAKAKLAYEDMIDCRRKTQASINALLQRKDTWSDTDITLFTQLYRKDLTLEGEEVGVKQSYKSATEAFERCHVQYLNEIRERYIEEQLYSDKIRQASTWWTWGLITAHLTMFIVLQLILEPRKRSIFQKELVDMIETRAASEQSQLAQTLQDQQRELLAKIDLSVGMKAGSIAAADSQQNGAKLASTSSLETKDDQLDLAASYAVGIATGSLLIPLFKWLV